MTRHGGLAEQLKALMEYRNRPEGPIETVKTNWKTIAAANDNNAEDLEDLHIERSRPMRPRLGEIRRAIEDGETVRNKAGQIVSIGELRFSDGTQTEKAYRFSADGKIMQYDARMPVGAMLGTSDKQERILGGDTEASNAAYTLVYGGRYPNKAKRKDPEKRAKEKPAPARTKSEMREEIAALPDFPVKHYKKGFPWKPTKLRELFMGLEKGKKGESGSVAWEDISTHIAGREVWAEALAALSDVDARAIAATETAKSFADVGKAAGQSPTYADKGGGGKKRLLVANDNLIAAIKKSAA